AQLSLPLTPGPPQLGFAFSNYTSIDGVCSRVRDLRAQRELRRCEGAVPRTADGHPLRPPLDAGGAGDSVGRRCAEDSRSARFGVDRRGTAGQERRELRGTLLLRSTACT